MEENNRIRKEPKRIPLPPLHKDLVEEDTPIKNKIIRPDNDSIYNPVINENNSQNNSESISELDSL